jgi:hypothetical protein
VTRGTASTRRLMKSEGIVGHRAACAVPLTVAAVTMSIAGAMTRAVSMVGPPTSAETLELVAASSWHNGPPNSTIVPVTPEAEEDVPSKPGGRTTLLGTVGTLKLGYPLLLYKRSTHPTIFSRVVKELYVGPGHDSSQPQATTLGQQQHLTPPHGRVSCRHVSRESDIF